MIKVSVIVPVYNVEAYIDKCIGSLIEQTLEDIQIIIVNDGSKDNSHKIIEKYCADYPDKILYVEKPNGGISDARNTGLRHAKGEYIGFVDADDYADKKMFEKMYMAAQREYADMVVCGYYSVYRNKLKFESPYARGGICRELSALKVAPWNKIIKRDILEKRMLNFTIGLHYEDVEFHLKTLPYIQKVEFIEEPLYYYVRRQGSEYSTRNERVVDYFTVLDNVIKYYTDNGFYETYKDLLEYYCIRALLCGAPFQIMKINDSGIKERIMKENWQKLLSLFPDWKRNPLLCGKFSLVHLFLRCLNNFTYALFFKLLDLRYR